MNTPPVNLDTSMIIAALHDGWGIVPDELRYAPLGFGSHHWTATTRTGERWWVTVDDLRASHLGRGEDEAFATLGAAFGTAAKLRDVALLPFVIAPVPGHYGEILIRLGPRYSIAVFPYLDVNPVEFSGFEATADRDEAMRLVGRIHNATGAVTVEALRGETLSIQDRDRLIAALGALDEPWTAGPYGEPARRLVRDARESLVGEMERFDRLAASVLRDTSDWVVTHGEPHAANAIRTRSGEMVMVDWDTAAFGPRERDLWMLVDDANPGWEPYRELTGVAEISDEVMAAYRLHWNLSEIAIFTGWCRGPHEQTEDMAVAWKELQRNVRQLL